MEQLPSATGRARRCRSLVARFASSLLPGLLLLSCQTSPPHPSSPILTPAAVFHPPLVSAAPSLRYGVEKARGMMFACSLPLLATQIDTGLLAAEGYAAWRAKAMERVTAVQAVKINFTSEAVPGQPDTQSGMLFLPVWPDGALHSLSWIIHTKGTELRRDAVPSRNAGMETPIAATYAALGYAVWAPDYAGMGDSAGTHPYCVPDSLAASAVDGLAAARQWLAAQSERAAALGQAPSWRESGRLYVLGYSEGGLAAMAAARRLVDTPLPGLNLESVYAMGAPLDLTTGAAEMVRQDSLQDHPEYQVFLAMGWARAWPDSIRLDRILRPRILSEAVPLFDGSRDADTLIAALGRITGKPRNGIRLSDLFTAEYLELVKTSSPEAALFARESDARLDRWLPPPDLPIFLAASETDRVVPPANSRSAVDWINATQPGSQVNLIRLGSASHVAAGGESLLWAIMHIDRREQELAGLLAVH